LSGINFDDFSENYDSLLEDQLALYGDVDNFGKSKVRLMRNMLRHGEEPKKIMDFGCGTGRNLPYLQAFFPKAQLFAFDISKKSLDTAVRNNMNITAIREEEIDSHENAFDAIFISGVFHHVEPESRDGVIQRIRRLLSDNGRIFVFEHNPYNPVTCRIVKDCAFDRDAILITKRDLANIFAHNQLYLVRSSYTLFVPPKFSGVNFIESFLHWLPLGGQYCAVFKR